KMTTSKHPKYIARPTQFTVLPKGDKTYSERATKITIIDEAAGEFVEVSQSGRDGGGKIAIDPEEWPAIRGAIDRLIDDCRPTPPLSSPAG
ncbi:MAG TPA: hypothetical protein PLR37_02345, partial [Candidatus Accumulibacter phosphatis]|nr:hypothetical protein [Candidatus Accumulibacter phosphatis]